MRSGLRSRADAFDIVFATASRVAQVSQVARITWVVAQKSSDIPSCFLKPAVTASDLQPLSNVSRRTELTAKGCISQSFASTRPRLKCQTFDLPSACSRKNCTSRQPLARISPTWRAFVRRLLFLSFLFLLRCVFFSRKFSRFLSALSRVLRCACCLSSSHAWRE